MMSACISFIIFTTSARVGSVMLMEAAELVVEATGDGGSAVDGGGGEDRRTRDTKLSRASNP
jgi:hypothetical protein